MRDMSQQVAERVLISLEDLLVDIGSIAKRTQLSGPQALMALGDLKDEIFRLRGVEVEVAPIKVIRDKAGPTTKVERFADALTLLCGGAKPNMDLVEAWFDDEDDQSHTELQSWAIDNSVARWAMGIGVIDAALTLADNPDEGVDHQF